MPEAEEITIESMLPRLRDELARCDYGEVTLTMSVHLGKIVRYGIIRSYTSKIVQVPLGGEEKG